MFWKSLIATFDMACVKKRTHRGFSADCRLDACCAMLSMAMQLMRMRINVGAGVTHHKCAEWKFGLCPQKKES